MLPKCCHALPHCVGVSFCVIIHTALLYILKGGENRLHWSEIMVNITTAILSIATTVNIIVKMVEHHRKDKKKRKRK